MRQGNLVRLAFIIVIALLSAYIVAPITKPDAIKSIAFWQDPRARDLQLKQGLDLKGGLQILLGAALPDGIVPTEAQMDTAKRIIEQRVGGLGVAEPLVQLQGSPVLDKILVELPGVADRAIAIDLLKQTGQLEFAEGDDTGRQLDGTTVTTTFGLDRSLLYPETSIGAKALSGDPTPGVLQTAFTGEILLDATPALDNVGRYVVSFRIKPAYASLFQTFTGSRIGRPLCIILDKQIRTCPTIQGALRDSGQITGQFDQAAAQQLSLVLNYGSLPVPMKLETTRDVGATLGAESVRRSVIAFAVALIALCVFMALYYRLPGLLAVAALLFFTVTSLALFVLFPVVLTLPGITGFVLSVATAVDANVLTFERFKEELRAGRTLRSAVETSFVRAWSSIRDSNIAALITCAVLYITSASFGASSVQGFAITLALGILMSLFSAVFVTRTLMRLAFNDKPADYVETHHAALGL